MTCFDLTTAEEAAYGAPFPSRTYLAEARSFPSLMDELGGNTAEAWAGLTPFEKPFLRLWASNDPGQLGSCAAQQRLIDNVPDAEGQPHDRLPETSHFLQDDQGTEIATRPVEWYPSLDKLPSQARPQQCPIGLVTSALCRGVRLVAQPN